MGVVELKATSNGDHLTAFDRGIEARHREVRDAEARAGK
jgi:hypothetical protein